MALIALALAGVAALAIPGSPAHKKVTLGLDLQGGLEVILKAEPRKGQKLHPGDLDTSVSIMRARIDKLGVTEPEIRKQGSDQIVIQLAGVHDPAKAAQLIGKTAQLEFYDLEADLTGPSISVNGFPNAMPSLYALLSGQQALVGQKGASQWYLFKDKKLVVGPTATKADLFTTRKAAKLGITAASVEQQRSLQAAAPKKKAKQPAKAKKPVYAALGVPNGTIVASCGKGTVVCPGVNQPNPTKTSWYLFKHTKLTAPSPIPEVTGADLKLSGTRADIDPTQGPVVLMQFTGKGAKIFQKITAAEAQRGHFRSSIVGQKVEQHFAIVLDREIKSFPSIDFNQYPNGISGSNGAQITGLGSFGEAKNLALVLQTGALPVNFKQIEQTQVSATLGKDSLQQAKKAAIGGLIAVVVFLLLLYRFLGLIAVLGLGIYAAFLYAAILLFHVTLTLPGFAGLILTIGVAADANVVVFERIKEEVRAGKSVRAAIGAGYAKGFHTILDANVVTAITALVLFAVATAQVKGFALMLLIGTVISLITAVAATRAMLGLLAGFSWFNNPRFMGAHGQQSLKWLQIDFMRRRYWWFAMSGVVVVLGAGALGLRGLNLGIDFKGGTQIAFKTTTPKSTADIRNVMSADGYADAIIQGRGSSTHGNYTNFQVRTKTLNGPTLSKVTADLRDKVGATHAGETSVSSSFGSQIAHAAILAIIVSLALVVIYVAIRFDFKFAVPVIIAMLHDVLIAVGIYALAHREVTSSTVAAILTVLGYSIYDTIIIFDRIRENIPLMRRSSIATITNVSLWETIRRSLATSFITLLPVASLFIFGGATLKDFAFALLVGITSGAYSSIFVAAPLLTMWKEREPEFARRKGETIGKRGLEATLEAAEEAAAAEPAPAFVAVPTAGGGDGAMAAKSAAQAKRERRRQRRRARPHGRAR